MIIKTRKLVKFIYVKMENLKFIQIVGVYPLASGVQTGCVKEPRGEFFCWFLINLFKYLIGVYVLIF